MPNLAEQLNVGAKQSLQNQKKSEKYNPSLWNEFFFFLSFL
jgi:hypothetical protein